MIVISSKMQYWLRFLIGGLLNTGLTYGLYFLLQKVFFYQIAYMIAYACGIVFSYWFNARIVFRTSLSWTGLMTYPLVYVVQYGCSALLLGIFIERLDIPPALAPLLVLVMMIPLTFFLSRWILRRRQHAS